MKTCKLKLYESSLSEILKIGDEDDARKIKRRIIDFSRYAKEARSAAKQATAEGKDELADKLNARAQELEDAVKN